MKRILLFILLAALFLLPTCGGTSEGEALYTFTDFLGRTVEVRSYDHCLRARRSRLNVEKRFLAYLGTRTSVLMMVATRKVLCTSMLKQMGYVSFI